MPEANVDPTQNHHLTNIAGLDAAVVAQLRSKGFHDAEQVIAAYGTSVGQEAFQQELGGAARASELLITLNKAVPAVAAQVQLAAALGASTQMSMGALAPTEEMHAQMMSRMVSMPAALAAVAELPSGVNHVSKMPPVRNQGSRGTCVAHALTAVHEFWLTQTTGYVDLSEQFLYHETKLIDGAPDTCGTFQVKAAEVLANLGECAETVWPYNPGLPCNNNGVEPANARAQAASRKLSTIVLDPKDVTAIKSALAGGSVVGFSVPVYASWYDSPAVTRSGRITMRLGSEASKGGHAMCLVGYQDDASTPGDGVFILRNSWGHAFGTECSYGVGYGTIPYGYIKNECWEAVTTPPPKKGATTTGSVTGDTSQSGPAAGSAGRGADAAWPFPHGEDTFREMITGRPQVVIENGGRYDIVIR